MVKVETIKLEKFLGVGVKWHGTFEQAGNGDLSRLLEEFKQRMSKLVHTHKIIGLSYHEDTTENSFTYYYLVMKEDIGEVPEGMEEVEVPASLYAAIEVNGTDVQSEYMNLYKWIEDRGYELNQDRFHYLEVYPVDYDPISEPPRLKIHVPFKM